MSDEQVQRRLAAILAADVVGYSRLMAEDEVGTLVTLRMLRRDVLNPLFTISGWIATQPIRDDAVREHFIEGYSKAGLPV
jgi:hypothetical protein